MTSVRGEDGWRAVHQKAFGKERWPGLHKALKGPVCHVALVNRFLTPDAQASVREAHQLVEHDSVPWTCSRREGAPIIDEEGPVGGDADDDVVAVEPPPGAIPSLLSSLAPPPSCGCYFLDGASVLAAHLVGVQSGDSVLDLCAAPGGKSLVLAMSLFGQATGRPGSADVPQGRLVCNESAKPRVRRLQKVLESFLPEDLLKSKAVHITNCDAACGGATPPQAISRLGPFDRVLVDAPCTSDRHLVRQGKSTLSHWAMGAVKGNAERQLELLLCASQLVRPGGLIVYCTCALAVQENDDVVAKFLKRRGSSFGLEPAPIAVDPANVAADSAIPETRVAPDPLADDAPVAADGGEPSPSGITSDSLDALTGVTTPPALPLSGADVTPLGCLLFLPDRSAYGPMYVARLRRL